MSIRTKSAALAVALVALVFAANAGAAPCNGPRWLEAWAAAPSHALTSYSDQSLRLVLTPLRSGNVARVRLSNRFGGLPITFGSAYIGQQEAGAKLVAGSNRPLEFDGSRQVTVPAGGEVLSDLVLIQFRAFEHLAVSVYVAAPAPLATEHFQAHQTSFISSPGSGDLTAQEDAAGFSTTTTTRPFVIGLETRVAGRNGVLVALGDSITDGDQRSPTLQELGVDEDARYPDFLARRLQRPVRGVRWSVLNEGIGGNTVLRDFPVFAGPSLLSRLDADVLARAGVTDVILLEGINDLGIPPSASADAVIAGLQAAVDRLEASDLNVLVGTLTPSEGAPEFLHGTAATNAKREAINEYVRESGIGDGVVDFDRALRDPEHPTRLLPLYDSGDHLHPSSAGYRRMAEEVDLATLKGLQCATH